MPYSPENLDDSLLARRAKNRQAQRQFRQRRQEALDAQEGRIRHLEHVAEQMSCVFMSFFDEMIKTKPIVEENPALGDHLRQTAARMLALARQVDEEQPRARTQEKEARPLSSQNHTQLGLPYTNSFPDTTRAGSSVRTARNIGAAVTQEESVSPISLPTEAPFMLKSSATRLQPFPYSVLDAGRPLQALSPFTTELLETTLRRAYVFLENAPDLSAEKVQRIFGFTLRHLTREQILAAQRWLLGPGRCSMHQAAEVYVTIGSYGNAPPGPRVLTWNSEFREDNLTSQPDWLGASDVQKELEWLGVEFVDDRTIEINTQHPRLYPLGSDDGDKAALRNPFGYIVQTKHIAPSISDASRIRIRQSLLIHQLCTRAVCFGTGPRYSRPDLARIIQALPSMV
ncbi:unnamed protein product [Clonostachys byssicola]|uniref:BZIP domain-containing protein n=1 Tax=Clonostachys byssicola TaxID=160290 RepID=A0A9N9Y2J3_9HYPO|nr:unnamed protein product [Clonostachys byssicola]